MEIYIKLFEVIFPVFFVIGIGYYLGKNNPNIDTNFITNFARLKKEEMGITKLCVKLNVAEEEVILHFKFSINCISSLNYISFSFYNDFC